MTGALEFTVKRIAAQEQVSGVLSATKQGLRNADRDVARGGHDDDQQCHAPEALRCLNALIHERSGDQLVSTGRGLHITGLNS